MPYNHLDGMNPKGLSMLHFNGFNFPQEIDLDYFFPDEEEFKDGESEFPIDGFIIKETSLQSIRPLSRLAIENVAMGKFSLTNSNRFDTIAGRVFAQKKRLRSESSTMRKIKR